jgi:hypothetical protein
MMERLIDPAIADLQTEYEEARAGGRRGPIAPAPRLRILLLALGMSTASFVLVGWIVPHSNQAFRETVAGTWVPRGPAEFTFGQLRRGLIEGMPVYEAFARNPE